MTNEQWLFIVKLILIELLVISGKDRLSERHWLKLKEEGLNPFQAVKTDFDIEKLPPINWRRVAEKFNMASG